MYQRSYQIRMNLNLIRQFIQLKFLFFTGVIKIIGFLFLRQIIIRFESIEWMLYSLTEGYSIQLPENE